MRKMLTRVAPRLRRRRQDVLHLQPVPLDAMSYGAFSPDWLNEHRVDLARARAQEVVGIGHVRREVASLVGRLRHPEVVRAAGGALPRGILFHGAPGTGKTLTARNLALQLGSDIPFFELSSDEVSPERARETLRYLAEAYDRSVLYIDEIDGFAMHRDAPQQTAVTRAVLVAFLAALDGLIESEGPIVIASSNRRPFELDPALVRPGRIGFAVAFDVPDEDERVQLFQVFSSNRQLEEPVDWRHLAQVARGQSPAGLRQVLDDALGLALAEDRAALRQADILEALRRSGQVLPDVTLDPDEVRVICVHEAGHVAAAVALEGPQFVYSVDVTVRGGLTQLGADEERHIVMPDAMLRARIVTAYAGMAAEELIFGAQSRPSDNDWSRATQTLLGRIEDGLDVHFPPIAPSEFGDELAESLKNRLADLVVRHAGQAMALAKDVVERNEAAIRAFAERLERERPLTGPALQAAIAEAGFTRLTDRAGWDG